MTPAEYQKFVYMTHRSTGYLDAASCVYKCHLQNEAKGRYHLVAPTVYLIGHSLELTLKALLFSEDSKADLKGYSHKLTDLWNDAKKYLDQDDLYEKIEILVQSYAPIYPQDLRYPEKQGTTQTLVDFDGYVSSSSNQSDIILPDLAIGQVNSLLQKILKEKKHA